MITTHPATPGLTLPPLSPLQVVAYIKRNKHRLRGVKALSTVGDIIAYGKSNNILRMVSDEPDLGPHHRGTVLVYRGRLLDAANEWQDLWVRSQHEDSEEQEFVLPPAFSNLLSTLQDAANARGGGRPPGWYHGMRAGVHPRSNRYGGLRSRKLARPGLLSYTLTGPTYHLKWNLRYLGRELKDRLDHTLEEFYWVDSTGFRRAPNYKRLYKTVRPPPPLFKTWNTTTK